MSDDHFIKLKLRENLPIYTIRQYMELKERLDKAQIELNEIKAARAKCQKTICEDCGSPLQRF